MDTVKLDTVSNPIEMNELMIGNGIVWRNQNFK